MLDILVMLVHILRTYLPPQVVWSPLKDWWDMITWVSCFSTILYCVFWTLRYLRLLRFRDSVCPLGLKRNLLCLQAEQDGLILG